MPTLNASRMPSRHAAIGARDRARVAGLRALLGRLAAASRLARGPRALSSMNEHLLRDLGLSRGDLEPLRPAGARPPPYSPPPREWT